jgi:hypothetical protein
LISNRARLCAAAHPRIALPLVDAERHKQDRALVDHVPHQFGEFATIANKDTYRPQSVSVMFTLLSPLKCHQMRWRVLVLLRRDTHRLRPPHDP